MARHVHYDPAIARTGTGETYYQSPEILAARADSKRRNKNAIVLNPQLAAGPSVLNNGQRDYDYTTNAQELYQSDYEKNNNRVIEWEGLTQEEKYLRQNRANVNQATLNQTRRNSDDEAKPGRSSDCNDSPSGCISMGVRLQKNKEKKKSPKQKESPPP